MVRTRLIVIPDHGLYFRVTNTSKDPGEFICSEENAPKDLLSSTQTSVLAQDESRQASTPAFLP